MLLLTLGFQVLCECLPSSDGHLIGLLSPLSSEPLLTHPPKPQTPGWTCLSIHSRKLPQGLSNLCLAHKWWCRWGVTIPLLLELHDSVAVSWGNTAHLPGTWKWGRGSCRNGQGVLLAFGAWTPSMTSPVQCTAQTHRVTIHHPPPPRCPADKYEVGGLLAPLLPPFTPDYQGA